LARQAGFDYRWAATLVYLEFLGAHPDSHVARKLGPEVAEALREQACAQAEAVRQVEHPQLLRARWREWDAALKARGLNPGTSADLTVATLFAGFLLAADRLDHLSLGAARHAAGASAGTVCSPVSCSINNSHDRRS
jgi:triphosphoribosyl-dephospho-CoA synthase